MTLANRIFLFILLILLTSFLLVTTNSFSLVDDDEMPNNGYLTIDYLPVTWFSILALPNSVLLGLGISIFAFFVAYRGGQLKNKRFNDRTIYLVNSLILIISRRLLYRVDFILPFETLQSGFDEITFDRVSVKPPLYLLRR